MLNALGEIDNMFENNAEQKRFITKKFIRKISKIQKKQHFYKTFSHISLQSMKLLTTFI